MSKADQMTVNPATEPENNPSPEDQSQTTSSTNNQTTTKTTEPPQAGSAANPYGAPEGLADFEPEDEGPAQGETSEPEAENALTSDAPFPRVNPEIEAYIASIVKGVGDILTKRLGVSEITDKEAMGVAVPAGSLLVQYGVDADPKTIAWFVMGSSTLAIVGSRAKERKTTIDGEAKEVKGSKDEQ